MGGCHIEEQVLQVAVKSFIRVRDIRYIDLINRIKSSRKLPNHDDQVCPHFRP